MNRPLNLLFKPIEEKTILWLGHRNEYLVLQNEAASILKQLQQKKPIENIAKQVAKKLDMSMDQVVINLDKFGNTSAATVPTALDEAIRDGRIQRGQNILLNAFGGGFTWSSALIKY